jgi:oligogalacturonide lyase
MALSARRWTRRQLLVAGFSATLLAEGQKGTEYPSDWRRYADPATELEVYRLTDPVYSSTLPPYYSRPIARRNGFLLFCCDRNGSPQAFQMDLKDGGTVQLTDARMLDGNSLSLLPDSRSAAYFDDRALRLIALANLREREIYTVPDQWQRCAGVSVTGDGGSALFAERQGDTSRLRSVSLARGAARTVVEAPFEIQHPIARPARAQVLYRDGERALWLVNSDGGQKRQLKLASGRIGPANWAPDGRALLYLRFPEDPALLNEIREHTPDSNTDKLVAKTSQFVHFGFNRDTSVFVGASRNNASPTVLLLLRVTRREFTLCEHKASAPQMVEPMFSPDAQRIYFESDRHGKPAIYCVHVERLVEKIETES